jgi:conserved oligomeric Golgi complex subunit 5
MLLQFETSKLQTYELDDVRDLTRAAASVSILEELLEDSDFPKVANKHQDSDGIFVVERLRPQAIERAAAVRDAAAFLLNNLMRSSSEASTISEAGTTQMIQQLGATLQVYYHLGEIHDAVWKLVKHAHTQVEKASRKIFNSETLSGLHDIAKKSVKDSKLVQKRLSQLREEAAQAWADSVLISATFVRNLHRVLCRKTDHGRRISYIDVIASGSIPNEYARVASDNKACKSSLFELFWGRFCISVYALSETFLQKDNGRNVKEISEFYPFIRSAGLGMVTHLFQTGSNNVSSGPSSMYDDAATGILGGTLFLDDEHLYRTLQLNASQNDSMKSSIAADSWTVASGLVDGTVRSGSLQVQHDSHSSSSTVLLSMKSAEWLALDGTPEKRNGLCLVKQNFVDSCFDRLSAPLQYMFPSDNIGIDSDGVAISSSLSLLPSKYDIQRFDETIRKELALADRKEGDDLTLVALVSATVVSMISDFCFRATNAMSCVDGETKYVLDDLSMSESLEHDRKLVSIMYAVRKYLEQAAEKTFATSGVPSILPHRQYAVKVCQEALSPALTIIDDAIKESVILPLCKALNRKIFEVLSRISRGVYLEVNDDSDDRSSGFINANFAPILETISKLYFSRFPPPYASLITEKFVSFTIYTYLSTVSLVRVVGESTRLRMTQDLTDLEMALEQIVSKGGSLLSLHRVDEGKPYSELRAVRQMLFWTGLQQNQDKTPQEIAKSLLREFWIKDVRPSTLFQYLFSFGPTLLSSPHHAKRIKAEEYVSSLVQFDGSVKEGEDSAWVVIMSCCDSYLQRVSTTASGSDGDPRIAHIVIALGQDLMRQKRI